MPRGARSSDVVTSAPRDTSERADWMNASDIEALENRGESERDRHEHRVERGLPTTHSPRYR